MNTLLPSTASAAFSVIAERFRRAGQFERTVALCREGLAVYPDHLSARVTLGCALVALGEDAAAHKELRAALKRAPDNLAAIRGLAELHERGLSEDVAEETVEPLPAAAAPARFEIEDVIELAEDVSLVMDLGELSDLDPVTGPDPEPVSVNSPAAAMSADPVAVFDEWLIAARARRAGLLSEYAAG